MVDTDYPPRIAVALDITVTCVSMSAIVEGMPLPRVKLIQAPDAAASSHTLASTLHRSRSTVKLVMETVLKNGIPDICVLAKDHWGAMNVDPSANRRAGLFWLIVDALSEAGVSVAEVPTFTLSSWLGATPAPGRKGAEQLVDQLKTFYPSLPPSPGKGFRYTTIAHALAGAMAAGIETEIDVTDERLRLLRGYAEGDDRKRANMAIQWPAACKVPSSVAAWYRKNNRETDNPAELAG